MSLHVSSNFAHGWLLHWQSRTGGYAAVLSCNGRTKEITGGSEHTTNNRMELQAVIAGLQALTRRCRVTVVTDSSMV
jgi:ribonuclease HI